MTSEPKVLIVDDVEANLISLDALLHDLGCTVIRAQDGNEALKQLLKHEFAVVLLDVQMPGMDGFEVAHYARANPATRDTPIIFLTAMHYHDESMLRGYGSGAVDYLWKPINGTVLRAKVRVFLELEVGKRKLKDEIEAHRKTLAALEAANVALRHFNDAAAHDLKAPVRAIRGFLQAIGPEAIAQLDAPARDYLERSAKAAERMDAMLDSLLSYARLQRGASKVVVDTVALVNQVRVDLAEELARANATLEMQPDLPRLLGDPERFYQLFFNLVSNAVKFRRPTEPLRIRVSAEVASGEALVCVADNGLGIDQAHQARVFQAFFRSHNPTNQKGSGLGLAICQQVVEQHGGRIWVESLRGEGARFYFTLPLG